MKHRYIALSVILALLVVALAYFYFANVHRENPKAIKIGVILPLTGDVATYGQSVKKGLDIVAESDKGKQFTFIYEDSMADKKAGISAFEKLAYGKVEYFIGDATSTVTYEIGPRIQAAGGVLLVPIATGDKIRNLGENIFMVSPRNEKQTQRIVTFIKKHFGDKKVGCLFKQNDYSVNIANTFLNLFQSDFYNQAYQEGQDDFRSLLSKFKAEGIDVVFLPGNYKETATILRQAREISYNAAFIGTDGTYSPKLIESAREASEGYFLTMMPIDYNSPMYLEVERQYLKKYKSPPDIFACYGYESGLIMVDAINSSPNKACKETVAYLRSHEFDSLTGIMRFENEGDPNRPGWEASRDFSVYIVRDRQFVLYE